MMEEAFQRALRADPDDLTARLVFADWLEEQGDPRGELVRLTWTLTQASGPRDRSCCEARLRSLLSAGVKPVGPHWTNSLGMSFAWVAAGTFLQGSPPDEPDRQDDETQHRVTLTRGFYAAVHPVTQAQWQAVMGTNPSCFPGPDRPVECVSWEECQEFCRRLAVIEGLGTPSPYRLLTEAEWEYACRAGTTSAFFFGPLLTPRLARFSARHPQRSGPADKSRQQTSPVAAFPANTWGVADMHGNVFEWCQDWYAPYPSHEVEDPIGQTQGPVRVLRGGSWHSPARRCRCACRAWGAPDYRGSDVGCRIAFRLDSDYTL